MALETKYGTVRVQPYMILQVVENSVLESYGIVAIARRSAKEKLKSVFTKKKSREGIEVELSESGTASIKVHVFVEFGISIPEVIKNVAERIKYDVQKTTGVEVSDIEVVVEGVND